MSSPAHTGAARRSTQQQQDKERASGAGGAAALRWQTMDEHYDPAAERRMVAAQRREAEDAFRQYLAALAPDGGQVDREDEAPTPSGHFRPLALTFAPLVIARQAVRLTQAQLAERAGISERTIRRIEAGESLPNVATLARIGRALGVPDRQLHALWRTR